MPAATAWMGESHFAAAPVALYGIVQLLAACAYFILTRSLIAAHGHDSPLAAAVGRDFKGKVSVVIWAVAILVSSLTPLAGLCSLRAGGHHLVHSRSSH